jgi:hypothetical protein
VRDRLDDVLPKPLLKLRRANMPLLLLVLGECV